MSQSSFIVAALLAAFVAYLAVNNRLRVYLAAIGI
jgi:small basic protein